MEYGTKKDDDTEFKSPPSNIPNQGKKTSTFQISSFILCAIIL
jgi:hypothetical protein